MKRLSVIVSVLLLVLMPVCLFAGGGSQAKPSGAAGAGQTLKVAAFLGGYGRAYWDDMVAQFQASHPGVKVELTIDPEIGNILAAQTAAGDYPDFIYLSQGDGSGLIPALIKNKELLEITDVFNGPAPDRSGTLKDLIIPGVLETTWMAPYKDGKIYLAPFNAAPTGMVYNKNLFETKGWKLPATWDEFYALDSELQKTANYVTIDGKQVKRSLYTYQGLYAGYNELVLWPAIASAGGMQAIYDIQSYKQGSFSTPAVRSVIEALAKLATGNYLMEGTVALNHTQSQTDMMLGKALFIPNGTWMEGEMAESPREAGFSFGMIAPPVVRAGQDRYVNSSLEQLSIPKGAKNIALAKEFLRSIYTKASVISFAKNANSTIAVKDARDIAGSYLSPGTNGMFSVYDTGKFMLFSFDTPPSNSKVDVYTLVFDELAQLVTGKITSTEYINRVEAAMAQVREDIAKSQ
jgi:N-acetylglucosamine transport system substrate-binding protein